MSDGQEMQWLLKEKYQGEKSEAFFADCRKLALGEPLGYLIGHVPFLNTTIYLDSRPLIPRPETEFWVTEAIKTMREYESHRLTLASPQPLAVLDLCAGSGCIGIAVAKALPTAHVTFSELENRHLATIKKNCEHNQLDQQQISLLHTSLFKDNQERYDFILSNPPYIDSTLHRVDQSVTDFEPHLALFGGADGMDVIQEIISEAPHHLTPAGQLWIEHEPEQVAAISSLAALHGFTATHCVDQYGVNRYSVLVI